MQILQALPRAYLSLFCCLSTAPQGGILSHFALPLVVSTFANTFPYFQKDFWLCTRVLSSRPSSVIGREELLWVQWCNSILLGNSICCTIDAQPLHAFYNHSHHLFIMSWTWGGLKADVTHDDLTSMGEWTRWLIVSKTNTLIISRRAQCNRSLTTNLYLS